MRSKEQFRIPVGSTETEIISGVLAFPEELSEHRPAVIIAHGAGNDMANPLIVAFADGLARVGHPTLRFNFPYKERGKKAPDRQDVLEKTWLSAYEFIKGKIGSIPSRIVGAGKSMGGRIASQLVAEERLPVERLIFLGYPLHPPGKKDKLRDAHLYRISIPMLFFAGTRDPLCDLDKLRLVLKNTDAPWTLDVIEGGDHSFNTPRSSGLKTEQVYARILEKSKDWLSTG